MRLWNSRVIIPINSGLMLNTSDDDIRRQNARLRCTLSERGEMAAYRSGHSAALGIALSALIGERFAEARRLITEAVLGEIESLDTAANNPLISLSVENSR